MRILITGGAGFIGTSTAKRLRLSGHEVTVLDNLSEQIHGPTPTWPEELADTCRVIKGDVRNAEGWRLGLEDADAVLHLAAETGTGQSMYTAGRYCDVNITGTAILADIILNKRSTIKKLVLASSRAVYGEGAYRTVDGDVVYPPARRPEDMARGIYEPRLPGAPEPIEPAPTPETAPAHPLSVYGLTKSVQESLLQMASTAASLPLVVLRYQNVYGPGQSLRNPYTGVLPVFASLIRSNHPIDVFEDGRPARDFVFISDVAQANVLALESALSGVNVFNIGSGVPVSLMGVIRSLETHLNLKSRAHISGNFRIGDIRCCYADISEARRRLGYEPAVGFDHGVGSFLEWLTRQPRGALDYAGSLREMSELAVLRSRQ